MKCRPTPRNTAMRVAARSHHLCIPLQRKRPSRKRKTVTAPIYIGPAVNGWGPQYIGRDLATSLRLP